MQLYKIIATSTHWPAAPLEQANAGTKVLSRNSRHLNVLYRRQLLNVPFVYVQHTALVFPPLRAWRCSWVLVEMGALATDVPVTVVALQAEPWPQLWGKSPTLTCGGS